MPTHALPRRQEASERSRVDRLDLFAGRGQRPAAQTSEDARLDPLAAGGLRPELALGEPSVAGQAAQDVGDDGGAEAEPAGGLGRGEWPVGAGVAGEQVGERVVDAGQVGLGHAHRQGGAQRVTQAAGVLDGGPPHLAADRHLDGAPAVAQLLEQGRGLTLGQPALDLVGRERPEHAQQVGDPLDAADPAVVGQALQLGLGALDDLRVEQLAQLGPTEQLGEQRGIEGERRGPALRQRGVALVEERGDVAEQQGLGERRRAFGGDLGDLHLARRDAAGQLGQRRQVVDVLQALAGRLEQDREVGVLAGDLEQLGGALPLLPQRRAGAGVAAGQEQSAGGALAEPGREQRRAADLGRDDLVELVGLEHEQLGARRLATGVGHARDDAVVGGDHRAVDAEPLEDAGADRQRPRACTRRPYGESSTTRQSPSSSRKRSTTRVRSVGTMPVASRCSSRNAARLVPARVSSSPGCLALQVAPHVVADGRAELVRPTDGVALPERQPGRLAERGRDDDAVVGDLLDAPAGGAEGEDVVDARLVDHLLVELADPPAPVLPPDSSTPSARVTANMPRSGMVPPLVTASHWAPGRPVSVPASRSQTSRGRSSANSSDG